MDDVGDYCRQVESHLTRVNAGHLVRITGPAFELVRQWAEEGIPLSVVFRGIELKADRHHAGQESRQRPSEPGRPLRIEFCAGDVRHVYEGWRRAVGVPRGEPQPQEADDSSPATKRPSLSKHLERVIERLGRVAGRLDLPESFRETLGLLLQEITALRETAKAARGPARDEFLARLGGIDERLMTAARRAAPLERLEQLGQAAARDLAPFRGRLAADAWQRALDVTVDRLLRDEYRLPAIEI